MFLWDSNPIDHPMPLCGHALGVHNVYNDYMATTLGSPLTVRLPEDLRVRVEEVALATRRSKGDVVREVLERELGDLEWELRIADRARAHRAGDLTAVSASKVDRLLGFDGAAPVGDALDAIS